uniref:proton-conducting transporter transmembrane domain-containing protein n=1 Tax=Halomonas sp. TaxID=1486246 RepID=UPI00356B544A
IAMGLGLLGIYYGAVLACGQQNVKRFIAYTSVAHMGFVLIGIYSGSLLALQGVIVLILAHAFSAAGLFILSGQLYERLHTREMDKMGGLWGRLGSLPGFWLFFIAASLGIPVTANFVGEFMVLFGTFPTAPWVVVIASFGLVLAAIYSLILMQRVHYGPPRSETPLKGLDAREFAMMLSIVVLLIWLGIYPQPLLDTTEAAMGEVQQVFETSGTALREISTGPGAPITLMPEAR